MTASRVLEVHRPTGYQHGGWPTCAVDGETWPCWDYNRATASEAPK